MSLRMLCNENVPRALVDALRSRGHDVAWVAETMPDATDQRVLQAAALEARVCVTFDKDFGELSARDAATAQAGVILLRLPCWPLREAVEAIAGAIDARRDWPGHFSVMEAGRLRMRRIALPGSQDGQPAKGP